MTELQNILLVRTDFLGDSVLSSVLIKILKQFEGVNIDVLCYNYNYPAFQFNPDLTNKFFLYKIPKNNEEQMHNNETYKTLYLQKYTMVLMLNRDLKTYKLLKYINTSWVFGHRLGVKSLRSKMFCKITELKGKFNYLPYNDDIHEVINQVNLLKFALDKIQLPTNIRLIENCYFYTADFNPDNKISRDENTIVVNISGRKDSLKYIPSSLALAIFEELQNARKNILIIATNDDLDRANQLIAELDAKNITLYIEPDLIKLANRISLYSYYVGADGGLLHIASGLHLKTIGLFNAQNVNAWHPWSKDQICLQSDSKKIYDITAKEVMKAYFQLERG